MTTDTAARLIAEARAVLRSKRANCCRHGVARDHCADCGREGGQTTTEESE